MCDDDIDGLISQNLPELCPSRVSALLDPDRGLYRRAIHSFTAANRRPDPLPLLPPFAIPVLSHTHSLCVSTSSYRGAHTSLSAITSSHTRFETASNRYPGADL